MFATVFLILAGVNSPLGLSAAIDLVRTPEFIKSLFLGPDLVWSRALTLSIGRLLLSFGIDSLKISECRTGRTTYPNYVWK